MRIPPGDRRFQQNPRDLCKFRFLGCGGSGKNVLRPRTALATMRIMRPSVQEVVTVSRRIPAHEQEVWVRLMPLTLPSRRRAAARLERRVQVYVVSARAANRSKSALFLLKPLPTARNRSLTTRQRAQAEKTSTTTLLLRKALVWRALLEAGAVTTQAAIARTEGVSRARITQILNLLHLPAALRSQLLSARPYLGQGEILERKIRSFLIKQQRLMVLGTNGSISLVGSDYGYPAY